MQQIVQCQTVDWLTRRYSCKLNENNDVGRLRRASCCWRSRSQKGSFMNLVEKELSRRVLRTVPLETLLGFLLDYKVDASAHNL